MDLDIQNDELWYNSVTDDHEYPINQRFDEYGNYRQRVEIQSTYVEPVDDSVDRCVIYHTNKHISTDHEDTCTTDTSFSTDVDDSRYYTGDHYSEEDKFTYYDT